MARVGCELAAASGDVAKSLACAPKAGHAGDRTSAKLPVLEPRNFGEPVVWRFRLGNPERHTYSYQVTLFRNDGGQVEMPPAQDGKEVLVLVPPAPQ